MAKNVFLFCFTTILTAGHSWQHLVTYGHCWSHFEISRNIPWQHNCPLLVTPGNCWSQIVGQSDQITEKAHFYTFILLNQVLGAVGIIWSQIVTAGHTWQNDFIPGNSITTIWWSLLALSGHNLHDIIANLSINTFQESYLLLFTLDSNWS